MTQSHKCIVLLHLEVKFEVQEKAGKTTKMLATEMAQKIVHGRVQHAHVEIDPGSPDCRELLLDVDMSVRSCE